MPLCGRQGNGRTGKGREGKKKREGRARQGSGRAPETGRRQLSWHADCGQLHFTIDQMGGGCRFEVVCDVAFRLRNTVCAAGPRFRPGRAAFKANGTGRAGPGFRPDLVGSVRLVGLVGLVELGLPLMVTITVSRVSVMVSVGVSVKYCCEFVTRLPLLHIYLVLFYTPDSKLTFSITIVSLSFLD